MKFFSRSSYTDKSKTSEEFIIFNLWNDDVTSKLAIDKSWKSANEITEGVELAVAGTPIILDDYYDN